MNAFSGIFFALGCLVGILFMNLSAHSVLEEKPNITLKEYWDGK